MADLDLARLEAVAQQLVARVRDDDPDANQRWLHAETSAEEREALLYVLAAAVPDDQRWSVLTAWCNGGRVETRQDLRRRTWRESQQRRRARSEAA